MKKSIIMFVASLAVFSLAMTFSISIQPANAQTVNCPAGYTCTPIATQPAGCPSGYTCTSVAPTSSSGYNSSGVGYAGVSGGGYYNSSNCFNYTFSTNFSLGSAGADVSALQTFLISSGFSIRNISAGWTQKGYFGSQTATALRLYQQSVGLTATGQLDVATRVYINGSCSTGTTATSTPPTHSSITVISPRQGDVLQVGTPVQINWGGSWSGNDTFNIMWSAKGQGGSVASHVTQTQAGCSGYGKGVCGIMWTPQTQADQAQITVARGTSGNTNDYGTSGWFSVASGSTNTTNQPTISSIIPSQGTANTTVTISGSNLTGATKVDFYGTNNQWWGSITNDVQNNITVSSSGTSLQFTLSGAFAYNVDGNLQVRVVTPAGSSNALPFSIVAPSTAINCPAGFTQNGNACIANQQPMTVYCPTSFTCVPISSQYPPIPTASGPSTGGSCPTGYNCYPITTSPPSVVIPSVSILANGSAGAQTVKSSDSLILSYTSQNAQYCTRDGGVSIWPNSSQLPTSASVTMPIPIPLTTYSSPTNNTMDFSVTCYGTGGTSARNTVSVDVVPPGLMMSSLSSLNPTSVAPGGTITVSGQNFDQLKTYVQIDGSSGQKVIPNSIVPTSLTFTVPSTLSVGPHTVQVSFQNTASSWPLSNSLNFTVTGN